MPLADGGMMSQTNHAPERGTEFHVYSLQRPARGSHAANADHVPPGVGADNTQDTPAAPMEMGPIPDGGGRVTIQRVGNRTTITTAAVPPGILPLARVAQETALGLMGLLAAIVILGPFARMFARRLERRAELMPAGGGNAGELRGQLVELQQSVDAMSLEVERISESQRFQTKLMVGQTTG